jgi:DNA-binding GntR family transcriptional regulator
VVACAQQAAVCERPCGRAAPVLEQADQPAAAADKDALPFLDLTPQLDDDIVSGTLAPGMRISPAETARRLGVSPMPVRDALALLEREGLVETAPRRWTRVVELSPELLEELVPLVSLLEQYAVSTAPAVSNDALDRLRRANAAFAAAIEDNDVKAAIDADTRFHDTLVELAANRSLERALELGDNKGAARAVGKNWRSDHRRGLHPDPDNRQGHAGRLLPVLQHAAGRPG